MGAGRVVVATTSFVELLDLSVEQIRQYARADYAVSLRLLRILADVSCVTSDPADLERIRYHADLVVAAARRSFPDESHDELERRRGAIRC